VCQEEAVTHLAVAFDNPIRSVRNGWFAGYKGHAGVPRSCARVSTSRRSIRTWVDSMRERPRWRE
jgi:hypothetical protein